MLWDYANTPGDCFICGAKTHILVKGTDTYFCKSKKCIKRAEVALKKFLDEW